MMIVMIYNLNLMSDYQSQLWVFCLNDWIVQVSLVFHCDALVRYSFRSDDLTKKLILFLLLDGL